MIKKTSMTSSNSPMNRLRLVKYLAQGNSIL